MNPSGLSDSPKGATENAGRCPHCGATTRLDDGTCLNCFLKEGLNAHGQASSQVFESVLSEVDVPDTHWRLGNYEILEEIGRGGMGVIYRAQQRHSRRIVALKRVIAYQSDSHETLVRFQREAEAAASLDHPNILPIYEVSESEDGLPFFSMKYATGGNLRAAIPALHSAPNECVRLMAKVVRAIAYAHDHGILHRDLQPGNILLDGNGEPMVGDFGLAKWLGETSDLTRTLTTFGTPGYIAPEQAEGAAGDITPAADIYSLGAILFHLLSGRPPFVGANVLSVIRQAATTPAPRLRSLAPSLDRDLETILARSLERDPKARYQTAGALAEDLERWIEGRPILARRVLVPARMWRWARRNPVLSGAVTACLVLVATVLLLLRGQFAHPPELPLPEKSIAVLPFENIGDNKENSEFAAGIQDDLLTSLAQIHDLKVISRTSVIAYEKPAGRNMRAIGRELGVANILEGSVRRVGDRVLVNVQLIDARNDRHLWAERYDRSVTDSIGLQGELATQIAAALKTTLAPEEKARLDVEPTTNSEAYVLYLTALGKEATDEIAAEKLYVQATAIDPKFALAYARASLLNSRIASFDQDRARKAKARAQAEEALRLSPTLGEAHMVLGLCLYWGEKKYDAALKEFEFAAAASPNNADIYTFVGGIYRVQGRWPEAVTSYDRALSLDPRNCRIAFRCAINHLVMRNWPAAAASYKRALEIMPDDLDSKIGLAYLEVVQNNNPAAGRKMLQSIPPGIDPDGMVTEARWDLAMLERDYASAEKILADYRGEEMEGPKTFYQGRIALARGDIESAQRYFAMARPAFEGRVRDDPADPNHGLLYAYMQRKEDALREARRAVELQPESQNAFYGALGAANLAMVYALVGEQDEAITLIERLLSIPGPVHGLDQPQNITLSELRLRWEWDSLRSNPRFQKILAAPEPKTNLTSMAPAAPVAPEKSIAVLPFENLSDDKQNAYFAAGIQDDVLTSLAQIHDLKVISRTSVMAYQKADGRNMREIGRELGVANILEGSVRRAGDHVLVNVQLIDAHNDQHLWAERYDRTVVDSIGLQGELATQIAAALKATLAPEEKARLNAGPTTNSEAYVLYLTALGKEATDWEAAEQLHVQATAIDPKFALAYAHASILNSWFFPERNAKARAQAEEALRLSPKLGKGHVALGLCLYVGEKKYDAALKEFEIAAATSPNDAYIYNYVGGIYRRQGRWRDAVANFDRAISLDPLNPHITQFAANNHFYLRDWAAAAAGSTRTLEIKPESMGARIALAYLEVFRNGNPAAGAKLLQNIPPGRDPYNRAALTRWDLAMLKRDYAAAERLSSDLPEHMVFPKTFYQARTALARGDMEAARRYFAATTPVLEARVRDHPDDADGHSWLGILYGYMRRKEDAIRESRRAVELEPESRDAFHGAVYSASLALVYALVGEEDAAMTLIERLLSTPGAVSWPDFPQNMTLADLHLRWEWDSLRSNPRFQKILAAPEPQTSLTSVAQATPAAPEKSIAVLPFENLSDDKQNAYFAAGIQDDVLTSLAQIHELKVISRTSVMAYQNPGGRNMREIAQALGVANVLEGSVRRVDNRVLVSVQLIDARSDLHLWAQRYDRTVADSIGLQGELAAQIAAALKAQLAPEEKASLETKPTDNPKAYAIYLQARGREGTGKNASVDDSATEQLYARAIAFDPNFALAHARRSIMNSRLGRRAEARTEAEAALRLSPSLGDAHTALGLSLYWGDKNYAAALKEFSIAAAISPNEPNMLGYIAGIYRRQGRWRESLATFQRAADLDPRNREILLLAANSHLFVRDWPGAKAGFNRELKIVPDAVFPRIGLAYLEIFQNNNPAAGRNILRSVPSGIDPDGTVAEARWDLAMLERDYDGAEKILADFSLNNFPFIGAPKTFFQGRTSFARGDVESAHRYFAAALPDIEEAVRENPDDPHERVTLALLYAYMQRKDGALREARRAVEMEPESQNAFHGAIYSANLALVYALVGEQNQAITLIERLLSTPGPIQWPDHPMNITLAELRLRWEWDSLRSNPRFQKILARPEPETVY